MLASIPMILNMSGGEIILIVFVFLMFFGSKSIPKVARTLGRGMREFRNASQEIRREIKESASEDEDLVNPIKELKDGLDIRKEIDN